MKLNTDAHPKLLDLAERLGLDQAWMAVGICEMLWLRTAHFCPQGDIGRFSDKQIARMIDWRADPTQLVQALVACGLLDEHKDHRLVVHDWHDHAPEYVKKRLARSKLTFLSRHDQTTADNGSQRHPLAPYVGRNGCLPGQEQAGQDQGKTRAGQEQAGQGVGGHDGDGGEPVSDGPLSPLAVCQDSAAPDSDWLQDDPDDVLCDIGVGEPVRTQLVDAGITTDAIRRVSDQVRKKPPNEFRAVDAEGNPNRLPMLVRMLADECGLKLRRSDVRKAAREIVLQADEARVIQARALQQRAQSPPIDVAERRDRIQQVRNAIAESAAKQKTTRGA